MSLHSHASAPIPDETQRGARAAFPRGHRSLQVAARLGPRSHDAQCAALCPTRGPPAASPAHWALATVLPCAAGVSERPAAEAVRSRRDGTSVLGLALTAPGFAQTVRSACRTRRIPGTAAPLLLEARLTLARAQGLLQARGRHRTDSTPV
jgi:hypothetical protein